MSEPQSEQYTQHDVDLYADICNVANLTAGSWAGLQWEKLTASFRPTHGVPNR